MKNCEFIMNDLKMQACLNIIPLRSYDLFIGIDSLEEHRVILNYYDKRFSCLDDEGNTIVVKGIPRKVTIREISALQVKMYAHK